MIEGPRVLSQVVSLRPDPTLFDVLSSARSRGCRRGTGPTAKFIGSVVYSSAPGAGAEGFILRGPIPSGSSPTTRVGGWVAPPTPGRSPRDDRTQSRSRTGGSGMGSDHPGRGKGPEIRETLDSSFVGCGRALDPAYGTTYRRAGGQGETRIAVSSLL